MRNSPYTVICRSSGSSSFHSLYIHHAGKLLLNVAILPSINTPEVGWIFASNVNWIFQNKSPNDFIRILWGLQGYLLCFRLNLLFYQFLPFHTSRQFVGESRKEIENGREIQMPARQTKTRGNKNGGRIYDSDSDVWIDYYLYCFQSLRCARNYVILSVRFVNCEVIDWNRAGVSNGERFCLFISSEMSLDESSQVDWRCWCRLCAKSTTDETVAAADTIELLHSIVERHQLATVGRDVISGCDCMV